MKTCPRIAAAMAGVALVARTAGAAIDIEQQLDRTAVTAGDRFRYSIVLTVPAGTKLAVEDFERKNINFSPLVVDGMTAGTTTLKGGGTRYRFDYQLSNYEIGNKTVELPRIVFRFQPPGDAGAQRPTTEEMAVPALPVSVRSTLNQPLAESWIQESLPTTGVSQPRWLLAAVAAGVLGLLVSSVPLWVSLRGRIVAWRARRAQPSWRQFLTRWASSLDELERSPHEVDIKQRFRRLEDLVGEYVLQTWKLSAVGLTPEQLRARLDALNVRAEVSEVLEMAAADAQNCRYSPPDGGAWEERFRQNVNGMRSLAA